MPLRWVSEKRGQDQVSASGWPINHAGDKAADSSAAYETGEDTQCNYKQELLHGAIELFLRPNT